MLTELDDMFRDIEVRRLALNDVIREGIALTRTLDRQCLLLAQTDKRARSRLAAPQERTWRGLVSMSAYDPTYQNRLDVAKSNANQASSLSALYRNITAYPEPSRT
jgi:hypothetical protein